MRKSSYVYPFSLIEYNINLCENKLENKKSEELKVLDIMEIQTRSRVECFFDTPFLFT